MEGIYKLPIDYKIDDIDIFAYKGVRLSNNIIIQQLSSYEWFYIYLPYMRNMINVLGNMFPGVEIGTYAEYRQFLSAAMESKKFNKYYFRLLKKLKIIQCNIRKFLYDNKIDILIDMFFLLYLFNTDGLKKKLKFRINQVFTRKNLTSEISSTNAKNMGGCRIVDKITPRPLKV